jgi:DNA-binding transcriptional LysR family regulator
VALLLEPYRRQHADVRMLFFESGVTDLEHRLDTGQLDVIIGCGFGRSRARKRVKLLEDPLVVCAKSHPHSGGGALTLKTVGQARLLLTQDLCGLATATDNLFKAANVVTDSYPGRAMSYGALEDWVELGLGCAVLPTYHVRNQALARPLTTPVGQPLTLALEATWKARIGAAEHLADFLSYLHRVVPSLARGMAK